MIRSMTGFGAGRAVAASEDLSVELKAVNHKFCEVRARLPRELAVLEQGLVRQVKDRLARGSVDVTVKRVGRTATAVVPTVDLALAREYRRAFAELAQAAGVPDDTTVSALAGLPGLIKLDEPTVDVEAARVALSQAAEAALEQLLAMRRQEGEAIGADLSARLEEVRRRVGALRDLAPGAVATYQARLEERLAELTRGVELDPARLAQEVAHLADRTDVAEELTRLASHLDQAFALLAGAEPSGRKLDFLVQELHREFNTIGSKSQDAAISLQVMAAKAEVERIREQVQNVE